MIKVKVKKDIISISGHANYDDYGKDIVCAAVSSVAMCSVEAIATFDENAVNVKKENDTLYYWKANSKVNKSNILEKITISHDSWGSIQEGKNIEKVNIHGLDVITGEIGTGAVIIQTSVDGITWSNADKGKYSNGLYTTDVLKNYHGSTQSYTLDGQLIKQGVYVSVSFLYEVRYEYTYYYTTEERYWYQLGFIGGTHTVEHEDKKVEYYELLAGMYDEDDNLIDIVIPKSVTSIGVSAFLGFRGGKGVATSLGSMIAMNPVMALSCFGIFLIFIAINGTYTLISQYIKNKSDKNSSV